MCDCSEEKDRRARERARKETAEACCLAEQAGISDSDFYDGAPSPPRFRPAQIALGAVGFLFALLALIYKRYLIPKSKKPSSLCIDSAKTKWPPPPPPPPKPSCKPRRSYT